MHPTPAPKKSSKKAVLITVGAVALVCCGGGAVAAITTLSGKSDKSEGKTAKAVAVGAPGRDGKFEFTVESITCGKDKIGSQFLSATAQGQYCSVAMTVKNIDKKPQNLDSTSQKAFGPDGAQYAADATGTMYANEENQFFLNQINPGNSVKGNLVFDIPKGGKISKLELHDSPFSGGVTVTAGS